ncbi:hypothetical protein [Shewanella baltica]|uniref:Uncharacterized protein n=1 Tax=Shewanella baltica (strain OS155 / ATCC BAA-1091) TaxID=325240 RepID=A3D643_SHEB5|nr:hypothetical protein [Shewanella baltica]ABN62206.1 hypothetical protein Sbal_2718 [Shewanella baltica OS155]AEH14545.1 hypothetical protein Sbal117_2851 [Shewanella baltica OS117]
MTNIVKINIDLNSGAVNIEAASESLNMIFDRLESFLPSLNDAKNQFSNCDYENADTVEVSGESSSNDEESVSVECNDKAPAKPKRSSSSKPETFKTVELGLDAELRQAFKDFYAEKSPTGQSDHVLTVIYWLIKNTDKEFLSKNEVFTGLRTVNEKAPKRLTSVLSNLALSSYIIKNGANSGLHHIGEDYVERELPKKKAK